MQSVFLSSDSTPVKIHKLDHVGFFHLLTYLLTFHFNQFSIDWILMPTLIWFIGFLFLSRSAIKFVYPIPTAPQQIPEKINKYEEFPPWFSILMFILIYKTDPFSTLPNLSLQHNEMIGLSILLSLGFLYFLKDTPSYIRLFNTKYSILKLQLILPYTTSYSDIEKAVKKLNAKNYSSNLLPNTILDPGNRREQMFPFFKQELLSFNFNFKDMDKDIPNLNDFVNYHINIVKAYNEIYGKINFEPLSKYFSREIYQAGSWENKSECLKLFYKELNELGYFQGEQGSTNAYQFFFHDNLRNWLNSSWAVIWFVETFDDMPDWFSEVFTELYQRDPHFFDTIEILASEEELEKMAFYETLKLSIILPNTNKHAHNVIKI